ncbi:hypothetical protein NKG94_20625 [Micromonospora sp. M12]
MFRSLMPARGRPAGPAAPPSRSRPVSPCSSPGPPRPPPVHPRPPARSRWSPGRPRPGARRRARRERRLRRAGGGERPHRRRDHRARPIRLHAARRGLRPPGGPAHPGEYVEFVLPSAANGITVRYSIPDAPQGGGITAPLRVAVNGKHLRTMTLTSQYSWLYNQYPFTNDPQAGLLHRTGGSPSASACRRPPRRTRASARRSGPRIFYDEQRLLLGRTYRAGDTIRLTAPPGSAAAWTVIDLLDSSWSHRRTSGCSRRTCSPSAPTPPAGGTPPTRSTGPSPSPGAPT